MAVRGDDGLPAPAVAVHDRRRRRLGAGFGRGYLLFPTRRRSCPTCRPTSSSPRSPTSWAARRRRPRAPATCCSCWRGFHIAVWAPDGFSKLLAAGLAAAFGLQTFIILGGVTRLIPLTGITLPFVSYGGSSIAANLVLVALLLMVSHRTTWCAQGSDLRASAPCRERLGGREQGHLTPLRRSAWCCSCADRQPDLDHGRARRLVRGAAREQACIWPRSSRSSAG